jgi:MFS family permease
VCEVVLAGLRGFRWLQTARTDAFYGWRVVAAAFVLAAFGWGMGFYGMPVYLQAIHHDRGWSVGIVSAAVTTHFVFGAVVVANLPVLYAHFGIPTATKAGAILLAFGVLAWASATAPWQLFIAAFLSGAGWAAMGAAAVNAIVSPWFIRSRPAALSMAYNGASIGGIVFSPFWAAAISALGFPIAATAIGILAILTMWSLADLFSRPPEQMGLLPDGDALGTLATSVASPAAQPRCQSLVWRDLKFLTLAGGMACGLFAQIGLIAHLYSLLVPALGPQRAGLAMGLATASAVIGRTLVGCLMPGDADRRLVACASYAVQIAGSLVFILAAGTSVPLLLLGIVLFGSGIGNATSLPPLIAQVEFLRDDVPRVVALTVATAQGAYAFAPTAFGLVREFAANGPAMAAGAAPGVFLAAAGAQGLAICAFLVGWKR